MRKASDLNPRKVGVGLLGCGVIGSELARSLGPSGINGARVVGIYDIVEQSANSLAASLDPVPVVHSSVSSLLAADELDVVVECASQAAAKEHAASVVESGRILMMMSSGALLDPAIYAALAAASERSGGRVIVPSGAVGGIDTLRAARATLREVTIVTTKPPIALAGSPGYADYEGREIKEPIVIYDGPASAAVERFPANVNVAAMVSLAGLGPEKTQVRVIADPDSPVRRHLAGSGCRPADFHNGYKMKRRRGSVSHNYYNTFPSLSLLQKPAILLLYVAV